LATVTVTSAFPASRGGDAAALVFEYMAATQAENGRQGISQSLLVMVMRDS
jgi:hypothetical protein